MQIDLHADDDRKYFKTSYPATRSVGRHTKFTVAFFSYVR